MSHKAYEMLIFTDAKENNNKFYELTLQENGELIAKWGRVGSTGQSKVSHGGQSEFNRTLAAKIAKGYVKTKTMAVASNSASSTVALAEAAKRDLIGDKNSAILVKLIERLTEINRHQIMSASNGNIKIDHTGLITTPLGMVTLNTVSEARTLLSKMEKNVSDKSFGSNTYIENLQKYLQLIPQKVPSKRGWGDIFFTEFSSLTQQNSLLDQLESSVDLYKQKEKDLLKQMAAGNSNVVEKLFSTTLESVEDTTVFKKLEKFYNENKNSRHVSSHLKLKNVFALKNMEFEKRFEEKSKKVGNIKQLWHGTRAFNVLSIFKNGLIIPKGGNYHITGRMFGDGVYFSDQSTKSLNYSYGYWGGAVEDNCFMLVADVAMGKEYVPTRSYGSYPVKGYDSVFAKANHSGVLNNEMIVYDLAQVNLKYLCEFASK